MAFEIENTAQGITVTNLCFAYPKGVQVLENISFEVSAGSRVLLAGATGSGKSTLLRCLKPELTPHGDLSGEILLDGHPVQEYNPQLSAGRVGFVMQDPKQQIVMDTVKAELAFGLENLATPPEIIQRRVAEIANYFGINSWVERSTSELSGGESQIVNLAAIIAMQPRTLLLDEPTAMLDPIAAREFIELVERVNTELGITILLVEHKQEDLLSGMNKVLYLDGGRLTFDGDTRDFAEWSYTSASPNRGALPVATRLFFQQTSRDDRVASDIPLDVCEGRWWLWQHKEQAAAALDAKQSSNTSEHSEDTTFANTTHTALPSTVLEAKHIWYRYGKEEPYILKDLSLKVSKGSILGIVGANASGKSTLLSLLFGTLKAQHGKVAQAPGLKFGLLPQDPTTLFLKDSLFEDLMDNAAVFGYGKAEVESMLVRVGLIQKKNRHPFDLSGGEQQKFALAKLLLTMPDVLLLDEPTKGLDSQTLSELRTLLKQESARGMTIITVSHDLEFVAATASECLMIFDGETVGRSHTREFFAGNMFYTTALQRITQGILENCSSVLEVPQQSSDEGLATVSTKDSDQRSEDDSLRYALHQVVDLQSLTDTM